MPTTTIDAPVTVKHKGLVKWVNDMAELCKPDQVYWCTGSQEEYDRLCDEMVEAGTFIRLNPELRPNSFLRGAIPAMWPAWRTARTSARCARRTPVRRTTGWPPTR